MKAEKLVTLSEYMKELEVEMANAHVHLGAVVIKRRNQSVERAYTVMEFKEWLELIK